MSDYFNMILFFFHMLFCIGT